MEDKMNSELLYGNNKWKYVNEKKLKVIKLYRLHFNFKFLEKVIFQFKIVCSLIWLNYFVKNLGGGLFLSILKALFWKWLLTVTTTYMVFFKHDILVFFLILWTKMFQLLLTSWKSTLFFSSSRWDLSIWFTGYVGGKSVHSIKK